MLALRPDYLPLPYAQALQRLHTHALPFDGHLAAATVETELRAPLSSVFAEFEPEPLLLPGNRVCLIDFGMFGRLDRAQRRRMGLMLLALISGDYRAVGTALLRMSILRPDADPRGFRDAVAELVEDWYEAETGMTAAQLPQLLLALLPTPSNLWGAWKEQRIDFLGAALELPDLVLELADTLRRRDVLDQLTTSVTVTSARDWLPALAGVATGGFILRGLRALTR